MRLVLGLFLLLSLSGCISERHFLRDSWPFGNPNAPVATSETAQRALGKVAVVAPIVPQLGNVWPGPVAPVPTLSDVQHNMTLPLGQGYTPSMPSPYAPGEAPPDDTGTGGGPVTGGSPFVVRPGAAPVIVPPPPGMTN